ncbi:MAG: peptide deformylase [Candidatus Gracilibacteria bacterium]
MSLKVEKGTDNKTLRTPSKEIAGATAELKNFAMDMIKTMDEERGVGLASPQVGRNIRMIVCKLNPGEKNEIILPMLNPEIIEISDATEIGEEGCLSIPGVWGQVERASKIIVRYKNLKNQEQALELVHFNARIIQHEIDHLDGVLFIDRALSLKEDKGKKRKKEENQI